MKIEKYSLIFFLQVNVNFTGNDPIRELLSWIFTMPYVCVRGTLGMANTRIYGLSPDDVERIAEVLRVAEVSQLYITCNVDSTFMFTN